MGWFLWYSNETDGVLIGDNGLLQVFRSQSEAEEQARTLNLVLSKEKSAFYDMNRITDWVASPSAATLDCPALLDAWNMFRDISASTETSFDSDENETLPIYNKLFWGCNLPAMTPSGEHYEPIWDTQEIQLLVHLMQSGLQMFRRNIGSDTGSANQRENKS